MKILNLHFLFWPRDVRVAQEEHGSRIKHLSLWNTGLLAKFLMLTLLSLALFKAPVPEFCCGSYRHQGQPHLLLPSECKFETFLFGFIDLNVYNR